MPLWDLDFARGFVLEALDTYAQLETAAIAAAKASGASLWYIRRNLSNVFSDSAGMAPGALNGPVGLVLDGAGSSSASQSTASAKPTIVVGPAGWPVLGLNGSSSWLSVTATPSMPYENWTVIAAARSNTGSGIFYAQRSEGNNDPIVGQLDHDNTTQGIRMVNRISGDASLAKGDTSLANKAVVVSGASSPDGHLTVRLGGLIAGQQTANLTGTSSVDRAGLGKSPRSSGDEYFSGTIALISRSGVANLNDGDRRAIERFGAFLIGAPFA